MNRILFVGLCLLGIFGFVLISSNTDLEKKSEEKIAKHINTNNPKSR